MKNHAVFIEQLECRQQMECMTAQVDTLASSVGQCLFDWPKGKKNVVVVINCANTKKLCLFAVNGRKIKLYIVALNWQVTPVG